MDSARWEQLQSLFHQAADLPEQEREVFLETACAGDAELRSQLRAMLRADSRDTSLLDRGLSDIAYRMVGASDGSLIQQEFGPYRLKRLLGEGGMGVVWLAERLDAGNLVAIKFLPHAGLSPARRERFTHEIKTLGKLRHRFIARLYDAGTLADGTPWFVMEYVEGVRFTDYCRDHNLSVEERLRLFRSVCEAVQYAHGQEIIHRDLKPSNILVDESGAPRLLDFGIARELRGLDGPTDHTQAGLRFLSPDYAPPEWIRDSNVGFYTDVYSLGVILYEILAGQLPFDRSRVEAAMETRSSAEPAAPSVAARRAGHANPRNGRLSKTAWSDLDVLCLKAMHKDAGQRYPSVEALIRDIDHYLHREPLEARPDSVRYRLGKFASRNRRALAGTSVVLMLVIGLVAFYTIRLARERNRANREAAIATAMNRFLTDDLLAQSDPFKSGNAQQSLVDAISQASPRIDAQFKEEPLIAARLHEAIAVAFDRRSDLARARPEYDRANDLFMKAEGPSSQDAIRVRLQRADMEARSGDPGSVALAEAIVKDAEAAISRIGQFRGKLEVRALSIRGLIAIQRNDVRSASQNFAEALLMAQQIASFDQAAFLKIKQRLAISYFRMGDGAKAEALFRELISASSRNGGGEDLNALPFHLSLAQALLNERKYAQAITEADLIYPVFLAKLGKDHDMTLMLLAARAAAEGSLHLWDGAIRDDQAAYTVLARKQGPGNLLAIETLSDTAESQCRAGRYVEGEANARQAWLESTKGFGPRAGITGACSYPLALCLIGKNKLEEASKLLENIDVEAVAQLSGDPNVGASFALAQGEIAARQGDYALADRYAQKAAPVFDRSDADSIDKQSLSDLKTAIDAHLRASR